MLFAAPATPIPLTPHGAPPSPTDVNGPTTPVEAPPIPDEYAQLLDELNGVSSWSQDTP